MLRRIMVGILLAAVWEVGCRTPSRVAEIRVQPVARAASGQGAAAARQETAAELHGRAFGLLRARDYPKALELYDRILASHATDAEALHHKAIALALSNRKAAALESLRLSLDAGFADAPRLARVLDMIDLRGEDAFDSLVREFEIVLAEDRAPTLENMKRILAEPRFRRFLPRLLPRYRSRELTGGTLQLLDDPDPSLVRTAVISLLHQNADEVTTRARIAALLGSSRAEIRETAAEYFVWHGTQAEREVLAGAAAREPDPFTLAAQRYALELIATRAAWAGLLSPPSQKSRLPKGTTCQDALGRLRDQPTVDVFRQVGDVYRLGWDVDPRLVYRDMNVDARVLAEHHACFNLAASIFRFAERRPNGNNVRSTDDPVAASFVAPVRDFFNSMRQSFGVHTGKGGPFGGSVHVGEDVAWHRDDGTVVSVADGVVRTVGHTYSWGFIAIVEHRLPKREGSYCSLYAHLAPSVSVASGQAVRKGQRIGAVGRSFTWENGGYPAHLHFGIHRGPYLQSRASVGAGSTGQEETSVPTWVRPDASWITGYVGRRHWADGAHGWVDPQQFIGERLEEAGGSGAARR